MATCPVSGNKDGDKQSQVDEMNQELSALSIKALKEMIRGAGLSLEGCIEKSDLVARAATIHKRAAPPNMKVSFAPSTSLSPPTQQSDEESEKRKFIVARASRDPPDILAVVHLAELWEMNWLIKGVEMSIPKCLALYGWLQMCWFSSENAQNALSLLQRAKDTNNSYGFLFWGLIVESAYDNAIDVGSEASTCYCESARLGNQYGMFNHAHVLAARGEHKKAIESWKIAMKHGPSLFELYRCYHYGHGCTQDDLKAKEYLQQAADDDYVPACTTLSEWYGSGWENVLHKNPKKQAYWCKKATSLSENQRLPIYLHPLRSLLGTNPTPAWWKSLRAVVELMKKSGEGTKSQGAASAEVDNTFDTSKFAFDGAERFMIQMNLTPSNEGGIGDFGSTPTNDLFLQRAESLVLKSDAMQLLQGIVEEISDVLTSSKVISSLEVCGSYGKGTAVSGCADLDLVAMTVKPFESDMYLSLQRHVANKLKDTLKVDIKNKPLAVSFTYKDVEIDVVIASPNIEPISQCYLSPRPRFFRRPSLSVQECAFLRAQPPLFGAVVRLLKNWRASADKWPHGCKPRSFLLELIALAAVQKINASQFTEESVRDGFITSLELLLQVTNGNLKLYWVDNYPEYCIQFENHDGPIVMDPFDPTNNLAGLLQIQDWHPLSQLAEQTLIAIRDCNLVQRVIQITPTAEQRVSAISPQYRFSCFVLRAEQLMSAGNLEEALDALAAASQIDSSNTKLQHMWDKCITQLFSEERMAKQSSLTEAELLLKLKDPTLYPVEASKLLMEAGKIGIPRSLSKAVSSFMQRDVNACKEMGISFSDFMRSRDEADNDHSEDDERDASMDELDSSLQISSPLSKSAFKDGKYNAWLILRQQTDKISSKELRELYTRASLQSVLADDALRVGKDVIGLDRTAASILASVTTTMGLGLQAHTLAAAKRLMQEASAEIQALPHCGLSLQVAANIVLVQIHMTNLAWVKASEALKPLLERNDLWNRADVCYFIGNTIVLTSNDREAAIPWHERGITADPTFRQNLWALGHAMIYAKSTLEADSEQKSRMRKTAEKHLWQYIKQGVPEDKERSDALYELVNMALCEENFQEAHRRLEMSIEADIKCTQIYNNPSYSAVKNRLQRFATKKEQVVAKLKGSVRSDDPGIDLFFDTLKTKLCGNPLLITIDPAMQMKNLESFLNMTKYLA